MRVGLNATCFNDRPSGARQRFVGLYGALIAARPDIEFIIYDPSDARPSGWFTGMGNVTARQTPIPSAGRLDKAVASLGFWKRRLRADGLDLFEQFNLPLVKAPDCPTVLTVHDMRDARAGRWPLGAVYRAIWRRALAGADHVITVSDTMREDILDFAPGTQVTRVYNGVDASPFEKAARLPADRPYLLAVGHVEPRKNYPTLVQALGILRRRGAAMPLVIVGRDGGSLQALDALIADHELADLVTIRSDVDHLTLASLYRGAAAIVFPSLYEGFGIPLIEAMAARRPPIVSDIAVFRELSEGQAPMFDPHDPGALADAIARVCGDPALAQRVILYGERRVRDFAFPLLARQVSALYDKVLGGKPRP